MDSNKNTKANTDTGKLRVGIIFGGRSMEHEISLMSATSVINAIDKDKYEVSMLGITKEGNWLKYNGPVESIESGKWQEIAEASDSSGAVIGYGGVSLLEDMDVAFPVLHGPYGEDGTIQGLFEMANIAYAGCGVLASAVSMDKAVSKEIFARAGIPMCKHIVIYREEAGCLNPNTDLTETKRMQINLLNRIESEISYPMFIKPANMGSSVGISKAVDKDELVIAIREASLHDRRILIEEGVSARELEVGIIGNYKPKASSVGEIIPSKEFYDYEAKYFDGGKSKMCVPADISYESAALIKKYALKAYEAIDGSGFARIDFFLEKATGRVLINEINTIPGFTKFSMFPSLWEHAGVEYKDQIDSIIKFAIERHKSKS